MYVTAFCCGMPSLVHMSLSDVVGKPKQRNLILCNDVLPRYDWLASDADYLQYREHYWNHLHVYILARKNTRSKPLAVYYL